MLKQLKDRFSERWRKRKERKGTANIQEVQLPARPDLSSLTRYERRKLMRRVNKERFRIGTRYWRSAWRGIHTQQEIGMIVRAAMKKEARENGSHD